MIRRLSFVILALVVVDDPSRDNGWSGYLKGKNSTQGGDQ